MTLPDTNKRSVAASYRGLLADPVLRKLAIAVAATAAVARHAR